jgi:SAM-dependent methyltransferase
MTRKREAMIPPKGAVFVGGGDFKKIGQLLLNLMIRYVDLKPDDTVLDIGCGIGRLAVPLTGYLNQKGAYYGFDIVKQGIDWCNRHIAKKHPNFHFLHTPLKNDLYNLETASEPHRFVFPYPDNQFDAIVLTSVFTHMLADDVANYLHQIHRVMAVNGKCMASFFILNENAKNNIRQKKTDFVFPFYHKNCYLMDEKVKEANVAYEEFFLLDLFRQANLKVEQIHYGGWSQGEMINEFDFQDIVVLSRH